MISEFIIGRDENINDVTVKAKILGRRIHALRCKPGKSGMIFRTGENTDTCGWVEILAVSDTCKYFKPEHVGGKIVLPPSPIGKRTWVDRLGDGESLVNEEWYDQPGSPPLFVLMEAK